MSGIEFIVSTVLASVPIALELYDRSGRVFEVFSTVKQYPREVLILEAKLSNQRTIFRNNAINLLTAITKDRVKVQEIKPFCDRKTNLKNYFRVAEAHQNQLQAWFEQATD